MAIRLRFEAPVLVMLLAIVCLGAPYANTMTPSEELQAEELQAEELQARVAIREVPDDPAGEPARPIPGAPPANPITFEGFSSVQVNIDPAGANIPGDAANEPSIAVDPTRPNNLAIGWRQFDTIASNFRQAGYAYTTDGGRSWTSPGVLEPGVFRSDPVLAHDSAGAFYYASLRVTGNDLLVDVFKSLDGGATWLPPAFAYGGDKEWITVDRSGGIGDGFVYETWSIAASCCGSNTFTRSTSGAQFFENPVPVQFNPVWGTMDVGPDGSLYIGGVELGNRALFYAAKSMNAQIPGATPTFVTSLIDMNGSVVGFAGGASPNPVGLLGQVSVAVDPSSGPTAGYVYLLASVAPFGADPLDVHFSRSTDGGATWSAPVRVNDDPLESGAWQWFGTMSVAPNGRIDVVWNDTRNTGIATESQLFYAFSTDGGLTWSPNRQVSPTWNSHLGFPNQDKIGDYYHMVSDRVGAHLAWAATFNGEQDVYYLRIGDYDCNDNGVPDTKDIATGTSPDGNGNGIPDECEGTVTAVAAALSPSAVRLGQNRPNPFNPSTTIHFDLPGPGAWVRLEVFDVEGRLVRTLIDDYVDASTGGTATWDGTNEHGESMASGVYYYRLGTPGFVETRKMVLIE